MEGNANSKDEKFGGIALIVLLLVFAMFVSPVNLVLWGWVKWIGLILVLFATAVAFALAETIPGKIVLIIIIWIGATAIMSHEDSSHFIRYEKYDSQHINPLSRLDFACVNKTNGNIHRSGNFWEFQNPWEPDLICTVLIIRDGGSINGIAYRSELALMPDLQSVDEFRRGVAMIALFHRDKEATQSVALRDAIRSCAERVTGGIAVEITSASIKTPPASKECDFSIFNLNWVEMRISRGGGEADDNN